MSFLTEAAIRRVATLERALYPTHLQHTFAAFLSHLQRRNHCRLGQDGLKQVDRAIETTSSSTVSTWFVRAGPEKREILLSGVAFRG